MTDLLTPLDIHDDDRTRNLSHHLHEGRLRRPDATGELPVVPADPAETLVFDQPAVPVLPPETGGPAPMTPVQQGRYRARHRMPWPLWQLLTVVAGTAFWSGALGGALVLLAAVMLAGGPR